MREQAQLDLRVVHRQKDAALARRERRLDGTPQLRARRNVLQIGVARRQTPRRGDGLVVRGVHTPVTTAQRAQRVQIGRLNLGLLTPVQNQAHDLVVAGKVAQHLGVGRIVAALGLFEALGRKSHNIKQHVRELHGAADVKGLVAGQVANAALDIGNLGRQALGQITQAVGIHEHARALHLGKHRHERHLNPIEHVGGVLAGHAVTQRCNQRQRQGRRASGGRRSVLASTLCAARRRQRHLQIRIGQIHLVKLGAVGIQQVGGNNGIEDARGIDCQRIHELELRRIDGRKLMQKRLHIRARHTAFHKQTREHAGNHAVGEVEALNLSRRTTVALLERKQALGRRQPQRARQPKERALFLVIVHHGGDPLAGINHAGDLSRNGTKRASIAGGCAQNGGNLKRAGSCPALAADQRQETVLHGGDTKRAQRRGNLIGGKRREGRRLKIELNGCIGADGRHLTAQQRVVDVCAQVFSHLALDLVSMRDDLVKAAVLRDERTRLFGADARYAGNVVRRIALQTVKIGHERRRDAVIQVVHALGRHDRHVGQALASRDHVDVLGHELIHVAVAGHQQHVAAGLLAQARHGSQDIVAFPALGLQNGHVERGEQLLDHGELRVQVGVHGRALRLVLRQHLHTHARLALVKRHDNAVGIKGIDHLEEHVQKTKDRVGGATVRRVHGRRHGVEGAMHERVAVDDGKGTALFRHIEYLALGWARFAHTSLHAPRPAATAHQASLPPRARA